MLAFKEKVNSRENESKRLGAIQEFSLVYTQTEMHIIHPRGAIDKQAAGYFSARLGAWVGGRAEDTNLEAIVMGLCLLRKSPAAFWGMLREMALPSLLLVSFALYCRFLDKNWILLNQIPLYMHWTNLRFPEVLCKLLWLERQVSFCHFFFFDLFSLSTLWYFDLSSAISFLNLLS